MVELYLHSSMCLHDMVLNLAKGKVYLILELPRRHFRLSSLVNNIQVTLKTENTEEKFPPYVPNITCCKIWKLAELTLSAEKVLHM
jgi:hypothetical protein